MLRRFKRLSLQRFYSNQPVKNLVEHLKNRSLIRISGPDVSEYLQGLITNDIKHLDSGSGSMFTMFLNTKGRVLYDAIIYRPSSESTYIIECDTAGKESLQKHLKMFRVRRKVDITNVDDEYKVSVLFNVTHDDSEKTVYSKQDLDGYIVPCDQMKDSPGSKKLYKDLVIYRDPRMTHLGSRIISNVDIDVGMQLGEIMNLEPSTDKDSYKYYRYSLGVGEGIVDLPPGDCFPLECNCDYLHGVSFHKGCYIGQELTARTHHTGVVRKRLMPMFFENLPTELPNENKIVHNNVRLGKLKGLEGNVGLGLLRISQALSFGSITIGNGVAKVVRPSWWPIEAPKEKRQKTAVTEEPTNTLVDDKKETVEKSHPEIKEEKLEVKYFQCEICDLREKYEYFGLDPPFLKKYKLCEEAYVIEDPFVPPKQGEIIILGSHCIKCNKAVCKYNNCGIFFNGTYCINCAKADAKSFPPSLQEKLNRIVLSN